MYALRERRQHVTQEDFEFAVAKVRISDNITSGSSLTLLHLHRFSRRTRRVTRLSTSCSRDVLYICLVIGLTLM